ncbi:lipopolysaccharide transport periplasmic protein LptA [Tolumonas lignilytica]|uniref:lipopolysaccharide transport periplasmic protein LptA n=1 Tax=Tolumonas lignilytica TaxID=1283284 RepID=UPI00046609D7
MRLTLSHVSFGLMLLFSASAFAKQSDYQQPVTVDSVSQQAELNANKVTFLQDVKITQGSIIIHADKVVVLRHEKGNDEMIATGYPATFFQILDNGKPVNASANELRYQLKDRLVTLTGKAELKQDDNQVNGDVIRYDIQKQQMVAQSSGKGSRVKTIFLPQEIDEFNKAGKQ